MTDRPRIAVVVYGSILHPDDLANLFDGVSGRAIPVTVDGFERVFNQEASWRETTGTHRAVLNVRRNKKRWFNGVFVPDLMRSEFREFRERERGYRLVQVEEESIASYNPADIEIDVTNDRPDIETQDLVVTPTGTKTRDDIQPINEYVELCRDGARQWGEKFLDDFIETTTLASGDPLSSYLS